MSEKRYEVRETHDSYDVVDTATGLEVCSSNIGDEMELLVDLLNQQTAELDTLRTQNRELRALLGDIARNAPQLEPPNPIAFSFWVAGQKARKALENL